MRFFHSFVTELAARATLSFWEQENVAMLFAFAGRKTQALDWLEKGYATRHSMMSFIGIDPHWDDLRSEPRFHELLRKLNLKLVLVEKLL